VEAAIKLVLDAGEWECRLDADELVVWSDYDGYDYSI